MASSPVNDTKHTVHRPAVLRSISSLELKEHHVEEALQNSTLVMGQFRPRSMSASVIADMDGGVDQMPDSMRPAAAILPDKVAASLEGKVRGMNEVKTVRKSIRPLTQEEAERMGRRPSSADQPSHTLSRRELEGFRQAFSFLDKNHNGSISAKEVHNLTKRFQGTKPDSAALQARFEASPYINKQGELVEEAFIQAVNDKRASGGVSLEESGRVFKLLDADGDGLISRNDMGMALLAMGESTSDGEIKAMMRTFDINSDGHLDEAEFNRLINSFSAPSAMLEANSAT